MFSNWFSDPGTGAGGLARCWPAASQVRFANLEKNTADNILFGWTPKQVIVAIVLLIFSTAVILCAVERIVPRSTAIGTVMALLTGIGVLAGMVGAFHRKAGEWKLALIAYRVAFWCLLLAVVLVPSYQNTKEAEEFRERWKTENATERIKHPEKGPQVP
jgi:hypothetical protein